jgi:hypothetical protein
MAANFWRAIADRVAGSANSGDLTGIDAARGFL